jgi:hypothetical protein
MKKLKLNEIKNNFLIEIIYSNKKITTRRTWNKVKEEINWRTDMKYSKAIV